MPAVSAAAAATVKCAKQARADTTARKLTAIREEFPQLNENHAAREGMPQFRNKSTVRKRTSPFGL